ncbi:hypothetical protein GCM10010172_56850 [Paractinoplanes ferrugineus]|uniref:Uncharacterized protein n=1 Tax=Paractinoplanes ferrugineus TaxID=113564 RepID=A0A919MFR1_9ACTN|nr:hypothetical protein [Actinoplanes ferrugineus]GIE10845.1 hypothetical protein Afe05nite_26850 [Actinoplanes ferrugineus]
MTGARRTALVVLLAAGVLLGWAGPARAHAGGLVATDARSRVVAISPSVAGLSIVTIESGAKLRLVNQGRLPVSIPGVTAPVQPGTTRTWAEPAATPAGRHADGDWSLTLDIGGSPVVVRGVFDRVTPPPFAPWWAGVLGLAVAVPLGCRRVRRGDLVLAGVGLLAMAASVTHVIGSSLAVTSAPFLGTFVDAAGVNLLAWPLIAGGVVAVGRGRPAGLLAVCAGAALTAVFVLPDVTSFHRSVLPFAGPATLERLLVVFALGGGAGTAIAGATVLRALAARPEAT